MQYRVLSPIMGSTGRHEIGELVVLNDQDAAELLALKAVEVHSQPFDALAEKADSSSI